ncbi:MerR family transcriptional regulator [Propionispora hippei]|uniref:DNA-binding transcriptional regulator, MerR family n=1 Tax=Propionispora hippei DSM 15287 TaxID=1123003 RepID=A0A1M6DNG3_9FIRM|nr:MerR family transcriptional regulator [Propionispora hippei]SHI74732.1 DNA-binding transcriptional regulator, MerR family [Propionispora hippei DSM 15287]
MLIKELSLKTGASIRSLRYYETKHLLHANRLDNGYRDYDETAVQKVKIIQLYLSLGLTTEDIVRIIDCPTSLSNRPLCQAAYKLYKTKLEEVNKQMAVLQQVQIRLEERINELEKN